MIRKTNFYLLILLFATACSSVPKYPQNACKIFGQKYLWYKSAKKSSDTYGAPIHIILAFVNKESGFNRWAKPKRNIGICYVDNQDINKWLVKNGYALAYKRYSDKYVLDEKYAKKNKLGIWEGTFTQPEKWMRIMN